VHFPAFRQSLLSIREQRADANLGILSVTFSDGSAWSSDASRTLYFAVPSNSGPATSCKEAPRLIASMDPQIVLAELRCDSDSKTPTNCTIVASSCQMTTCGCAQYGCYCTYDCQCKKCVWHN
jgi:hypothetical protein